MNRSQKYTKRLKRDGWEKHEPVEVQTPWIARVTQTRLPIQGLRGFSIKYSIATLLWSQSEPEVFEIFIKTGFTFYVVVKNVTPK